ncbi:uncharacterized protein PV07_05270 [Cladophialophora immunda]|uniref:Uncharacterized protein n=1 Tax=Cladophialophora immunda TaxID=569365 RepID=A0A0D1ZNE2_9EURO|nr:uncharacterized protein PV07_05270 [Cladophialophora immunda]KIW29456.1 hypothetical protein PV07_05270 [Cladophialophora immunda]OQV00600.1 hypothetical protein CLAIMM_06077 [Cladophialophora immunda]
MPPNRKKNRRNKVATQAQTQSTPTPKTVSCPRCNEQIVIPKTCKHGKKLINCQGTGCTTAHFDEHNANCRLVPPSNPADTPSGMSGMPKPRSPSVQVSDLSKTFQSAHTAAMGTLSEQLTALKKRRGKDPRYVQGIPIGEWLRMLEGGRVQQVNQWTEKLKDLVQGKKTAEEIEYDDEDSDDEGDRCPTPSEDE